MKKILTISLILFSLIFVYLLTYEKKIYYLSISNSTNKIDDYNIIIKKYLKDNNILEKYIDMFSNVSYRTTDYINFLEDNKEIKYNNKKITFKNALIKADIITISLGLPDYLFNLNLNNNDSNNLIEIRNDIICFLNSVREYSKEDIFFTALYNPYKNLENQKQNNLYIKKLNKEIKEECKKININFIEVKNENLNENSLFLDYKTNKKISNKIINIIKNKTLTD